MGVKFAREYNEIIHDLSAAICDVDRFYEMIYMDADTWNGLEEKEQVECAKTLADDVFYGLGTESTLRIGRGIVRYDWRKHVITVDDGAKCVNIVYLL